jgi:hypothetical protein
LGIEVVSYGLTNSGEEVPQARHEIDFLPRAAPTSLMKNWTRKTHMGPFGMILSMIDTSRGRALVYSWRYLLSIAIVALTALWFQKEPVT